MEKIVHILWTAYTKKPGFISHNNLNLTIKLIIEKVFTFIFLLLNFWKLL